jgi:hypothetical protein
LGTPLRTGAEGMVVMAVAEEGDWTKVPIQEPTRREHAVETVADEK